MPPKGKSNAASIPRRNAPARSAKTRSAANTASMYKEAQEYVEPSSDFSDEISDPEDIVSDPEDDDEVTDSFNEEEVRPHKSSRRAAPAKKRGAVKAIGRHTKSSPSGSSAKGKDKEATDRDSGQGTSRSLSTYKERTLSDMKPESGKRTPMKRKISETKFVLGRSSSVPTTPSVASPVIPKNQLKNRAASLNRRGMEAENTYKRKMETETNMTNGSPLYAAYNPLEDQWTEKYAPRDISELAINNGGPILVLTGPAGTGKTAVLRMLAKEMNLDIVEWINSVNENNLIRRAGLPDQGGSKKSDSVDDEYTPVMKAFQEFISRAQRFSPLALGDDIFGNSPAMEKKSSGKNIILLEDLPPVSATSSLRIFQDTILNFANTRSSTASVLVVIVSDAFSKQNTELIFSSNDNREQAYSIRTLLPKTLLDRLDSAKTFMTKAIKAIVDEEFVGKKRYAPTLEEIKQLIEIHDGDIRAVINSLQFLCYLPLASRESYRTAAQELEEDKYIDSELKVQQGHDSSLDLFHACGKVLYNKRDWRTLMEYDPDVVKIPPQATALRKHRPSLYFNPEKGLIEKLPVEPNLFVLMLHQNYTRHMFDIEECSTAMDYLCISEQFSNPPTVNFAQMAQMEPYMTSLAVRGVLFAPMRQGPPVDHRRKAWWPEYFGVNNTKRTNDESFSELTEDFVGDEAKGLSSGHILGPGFLPKSVVREEIVPMLSKCAAMNPYMPIFQRIRPSSKSFIRNTVGVYGRKYGAAKEFGEGDEGFLEEIVYQNDDAEGAVGSQAGQLGTGKVGQAGQSQTPNTPNSPFSSSPSSWMSQKKATPPASKLGSTHYQILEDEDPIGDFSD
ncbi:Cell cycle checkpoint protein rad17 [Podila clonocystis]|nr:Cell cycle checkpoint protein rad17 [Podila clonocystis]